ncbi:hypothetical protein LCGC14_1366250 [marine sediment metagenome]|uniref:Uncharacterized protein n=1 Tax=marine sediment metagenome TaxID=412755 RepID=A0A0F9KSN1_9ZZZZ
MSEKYFHILEMSYYPRNEGYTEIRKKFKEFEEAYSYGEELQKKWSAGNLTYSELKIKYVEVLNRNDFLDLEE